MPGLRRRQRAKRIEDGRRELLVPEVRLAGHGTHAKVRRRNQRPNKAARRAAELTTTTTAAAGATETKDDDQARPVVEDALGAEAARLDHQAASADDPARQAEGELLPRAPDWEGEARALVDMIADRLADFWPRTREVYTEAKRAELAKQGALVMKKHNLTLADIFGAYAPEIFLALAFSGTIAPAWQAIVLDHRDYKAKQRSSSAPPASSPNEPPPASSAPRADAPAAVPPDPFVGRAI